MPAEASVAKMTIVRFISIFSLSKVDDQQTPALAATFQLGVHAQACVPAWEWRAQQWQ
jgi:hypothetical protein